MKIKGKSTEFTINVHCWVDGKKATIIWISYTCTNNQCTYIGSKYTIKYHDTIQLRSKNADKLK